MPTLRELLRHYREQRGLSQEELAALVQPPLSPDTISNLERGRTRPYRHTLEALCQALGLDEPARQAVWATWRIADRGAERDPTSGSRTVPGRTVLAQPTSLIGRTQELEALQQRLLQPEVRLLTLAGPGGVGKTRLALGLLQRVEAQFCHGVVFVDLSALQDANVVMPTIARALGVRDVGGQSILQLLLETLRTCTLLLVLDNFEQVLDAAAGLAELVSACPDVKLLVTSREPLRLRWEHLYVVPPLGVPEPRELPSLDAVRKAPAVALFVERAHAADESFALTEASAATIATLSRRLDGLPLALELAAGRVRTLSPTMLLDHLDRQLDLLMGARDAPARQQSLRATLNWSYELLDPAEQVLFRRLGIFAGRCRLGAAEAICSDTPAEVLSVLLALVDKNLLRQEDAADGARRYWLLETVRAYALEQLRARGEQPATAARHARYYLEVAEAAAPRLDGPLQVTWLDRLEEEHDNMRAALRWFVDTRDAEAGLRLAVALHAFWLSRGHVAEGRAWFDALLFVPQTSSSETVRARALNCAGLLASTEHELAVSRDLHHAALELARAVSDAGSVATALRRLGHIAAEMNDAETASSYFREALSVSRAHHFQKELAQTLQELGDAAVNEFDYPTAQRVLEESLDLFRQMGDRQGIARVAFSLGLVAFGRNDDRAAATWFEQSLGLYTEINDAAWVAGVALYLGLAVLRCGERARARSLLVDSLLIAQATRDHHAVAQALEGLSSLAAAQGDPRRALRLCAAAAEIRTQLGLPLPAWDKGWLDAALATARAALGDTLPTSGPSMSLDQVVQYALEGEDEPTPHAH